MLGGAKPKGISLHVGLNRVDPIHYTGWKGELAACENDARDMETIARSQGFVAQSLLTKAAMGLAQGFPVPRNDRQATDSGQDSHPEPAAERRTGENT